MKRKATLRTILFWVWIYGIAMAYFESAVVVYLRAIYYPNGFVFPLKMIPANLAVIEIGREVITMVMLLAVSFLAGRNFWQRLSFFMMSFGIWDIFYYFWLKVFLGWPASFLTWDILYLIPVPWTGPVLAPVLVSVTMIIAAFLILKLDRKGAVLSAAKWEWTLTGLSAVLIVVSFIFDFRNIVHQGMPRPFHWGIFWTGLLLGIGVFIRWYYRTIRKSA
ncbi:hypothetical protein BMS3Abin05_01822 [bacterium BMS3Abin05]|nr:hypothetical protein BMS3Abin05_01822 [bacterium BMS3Abin05]